MINDVSFRVSTSAPNYDQLNQLCAYAWDNDLEPPPTWGREEASLITAAAQITERIYLALEEGIAPEQLPDDVGDPGAYQEIMNIVSSALPLMIDVINHHSPPFLKFEACDSEMTFVPDREAIDRALGEGAIFDNPDRTPSIYETNGCTICLDARGCVAWML